MQQTSSSAEQFEKKIATKNRQIDKLLSKLSRYDHDLELQSRNISDLQTSIAVLDNEKDNVAQSIYNQYDLTIEELDKLYAKQPLNHTKNNNHILTLKTRLKDLGMVNPLAMQELNEAKQLYDHNHTQMQDIITAQKKIFDLLKDIETRSTEIFLDMFQTINENFANAFQELFLGGSARLFLEDPQKPLESHILIQVQPPGKQLRSIRLLSGGEKTMTAIALMFAIYMTKSPPICILDEIDAPLDDINVLRFLKLLNNFKANTQFILITHNKQTMAQTKNIFGVTMEEPGISQIVSISLDQK